MLGLTSGVKERNGKSSRELGFVIVGSCGCVVADCGVMVRWWISGFFVGCCCLLLQTFFIRLRVLCWFLKTLALLLICMVLIHLKIEREGKQKPIKSAA